MRVDANGVGAVVAGRLALSLDAVQIFPVADHFPRPLAAILSSIPDWRRTE